MPNAKNLSTELVEATSAGPLTLIPSNSTLKDMDKAHIQFLPQLQLAERSTVNVIVVESLQEVEGCVQQLRQSLLEDATGSDALKGIQVLGFDTETRPKFGKGNYSNPVALIQLATTKLVVLFRVCKLRRIPDSVLELLADPAILKVGIGVKSDVAAIRTLSPSFDDGGSFFNLEGVYHRVFPELQRLGLRNLAASVLRQRMSKAAQLSNWEGPMSSKMLNYAANDAITGLQLLHGIVGRIPLADGTEALPPGATALTERLAAARSSSEVDESSIFVPKSKRASMKPGGGLHRCATRGCKGKGVDQDKSDRQWYCEPCFVAWESNYKV